MKDEETKVIVLYIEGIKRGKDFVELARKITKIKPVVILKAGRTAAGVSAAHSHTAALAGDYASQEAIFKQFGFTVANDISELLYYAKMFVSEKMPQGNRVAIITNGGGAGVLTTDAIASSGVLQLAELSPKTVAGIKKTMPPLVNSRNPLDLAGDADGARYTLALNMLNDDQNIDMFIVIALFQTPGADSALAAKLVDFKDKTDKPVIAISIGAEYTEMHKIMMESAGLPVYDSPAAAALSLSGLYKYAQYRKRK